MELKRIGSIDTNDLVFKEIILKGRWFNAWQKSLSREELMKWLSYVIEDIESGSDMFVTKVHQRFKLEEYEKAYETYLANMSEGKVVLNPHNIKLKVML